MKHNYSYHSLPSVVADGRGGNEADGEDLKQHSSHGKGPADVEGSRCCPTRRNKHE